MAKILEYDGVVIGAGHNGMICAAYLAKCGQKIMVVEKNMEVGGGLGLARRPQLCRFLAQHSFGVSSRLDDAAVVQRSGVGQFRHPLLSARSRSRASLSRQNLSRLVRRREKNRRNDRAILQKRRRVVHGYLDPLAAGGAEDRFYRDLCGAAADGREAAASGKNSRGARVSKIFRDHARGICSEDTSNIRACARLSPFSASCAATSWTRRRPAI